MANPKDDFHTFMVRNSNAGDVVAEAVLRKKPDDSRAGIDAIRGKTCCDHGGDVE
jgi:hypothetical protein